MIPAHRIEIRNWCFLPEYFVAINTHNGARAYFYRTPIGGWALSCTNYPADWMVDDLAQWFCRWITGLTPPANQEQ